MMVELIRVHWDSCEGPNQSIGYLSIACKMQRIALFLRCLINVSQSMTVWRSDNWSSVMSLYIK